MTTPRKPVHTHKVRCQVCSHPERHRIETLRLAGSSGDVLAERFSIGRDALYRHMIKHVDADMKAMIVADVPMTELAERAVAESMSLLDYLSLTRNVVLGQMLGAASVNDRSGTAKLAGRAVEVLEQIGKLTGELMASPTVMSVTNNYTAIMASPAFLKLEQMLVSTLAPYPDALKAVVTGLEALEAEQAPQPSPRSGPPMLEGSIAA